MLGQVRVFAPLRGMAVLALSMAGEVVAAASRDPLVSVCLEAPFDIETFQDKVKRLLAAAGDERSPGPDGVVPRTPTPVEQDR